MSFTIVPQLNQQIISYLTPLDLMRLEIVSKSNKSLEKPWESWGYRDKAEFKDLLNRTLSICHKKDQKSVKKFILNGRIKGHSIKELFCKIPLKIERCLTYAGIKALALGILSSSEIAEMKSHQRIYCLSKNGIKLIKMGILTSTEIGRMDVNTCQVILNHTYTSQLVKGEITIEKLSQLVSELFNLI